MGIGRNDQITANHAELIAIQKAMAYIERVWACLGNFPPDVRKLALPTIIASDSTTALRALA
jgi:hypothetical protein